MKTKLEKLALGLLLAPLAPLALFLGAWWGSYELLPEQWIPYSAATGLLLGLLADIFLLKYLIDRAYKLSMAFWVAVFLFYTVGVFGFFMGVPIFNALLALPAGFFVGGRLAAENADSVRVRRVAKRTAIFITAVLFLICAASAFIALASPSTPYDLQGMLGFEVSYGMIVGLIVVGGLALLAFGWGLAVVSVRLTHRSLLQAR